MWIEKKKDGTYLYRESYKDPYTEKKRTVSVIKKSKSNQAKKQAQFELNEKIEEILSVKQLKKITFETLQSEWWTIHQTKIRKSSIATYKTTLRYINSRIDKDILVTNFDARYFQDFVNNFPDYYKHKTKLNTLSLLRQMFEYGINMEYLDQNPLERITMHRPAITKETHNLIEDNYLEPHEMRLLLNRYYSDPRSHRTGHLAEFMYLTGLRIGEAISLYKKDYNRECKTIAITGTLDYASDGYKNAAKEMTKTAASYRTIDLSDRAIEILDIVIVTNEIKYEDYSNDDYIFLGSTGNPIRHTSFNKSLQSQNEALGKNKINKRISSHIFRHSHISLLAEMGIPIKAIMQRVGHVDEKTTLQIYTHVTESQKIDIINKMNEKGY